jgi:hypothetical protein
MYGGMSNNKNSSKFFADFAPTTSEELAAVAARAAIRARWDAMAPAQRERALATRIDLDEYVAEYETDEASES